MEMRKKYYLELKRIATNYLLNAKKAFDLFTDEFIKVYPEITPLADGEQIIFTDKALDKDFYSFEEIENFYGKRW